MSRFSKYYLQTILCLDDGLCSYYVQDGLSSHNEILDVPVVVFDHEQDAEQMLRACIEYNAFSAVNRLRSFLAEECQGYHFIYQMDDHEVVQAVADELTGRSYRIVIEPGQGWSVKVDEITSRQTMPVIIEPEPDVSPELKAVKHHLDELVADQRKKYNEIEAKLAIMSEAERAAIYAQKAGSGVFSSVFGGIINIVKAIPGFVKGYAKTLYKVTQYPSELAAIAVEAIATGSMGPLEAEIDKVVLPLVNTYEEVNRYKSILFVLLDDEQTMAVLRDFGERYYKATHPLELTEMGAESATDIVMTILLSIPTGGTGGAANIAAKAPKLAKVVELLERLAKMLKRVGYRSKLPTKRRGGAVKNVKNKSVKAAKHDILDVKKPEMVKGKNKLFSEGNDIGKKANGSNKVPDNKSQKVASNKIKNRDDFKSPAEAYAHVRNIDGDIEEIRKLDLKISKAEIDITKENVREWLPEDEYPGIDYLKIDNALDNCAGKEFSEKELKGIKDYLFDNPKFKPPVNASKELNEPYFNNAESWIRLANGKGNHADDILIKHEILETKLKHDAGLEQLGEKLGKDWFQTHNDCHQVSEEIFNYVEAIESVK